MNALSAAELLTCWERGLSCSAVEQALLLLAAACPDATRDALARLSIGRRDGRVLTLREKTFGAYLICQADCPGCGERLEMTFATADIRAEATDDPPEEMVIHAADHTVRFRLPNSEDLRTIASAPDTATARRCLLERCILGGSGGQTDTLPEEVATAVAARMAESDPQADIRLALDCPSCHRAWQAPFDVVSFFWTEIDAWARRLLSEVHVLATAYGWREADILALSPMRRQMYLNMVRG